MNGELYYEAEAECKDGSIIYRLFAYLNRVTLACVPDENGFDVVINDVKFFHVAEFAFDHLPTFVYCTIGIMRELYFESIKTAE